MTFTNSKEIINVLTKWHQLLKDISQITLCPDMEMSQMETLMAQRQNTIEKLQGLDGSLVKIANLRRLGWPKIDFGSPELVENLIESGKSISQEVITQDRQVLEFMSKKRSGILNKLKVSNKGRKYHPAKAQPPAPPAVIVDNRA